MKSYNELVEYLTEDVDINEKASEDVIIGLKRWVEDYKTLRKNKRTKEAIKLRDTIKAEMKKEKLSKKQIEDVWGDDPDDPKNRMSESTLDENIHLKRGLKTIINKIEDKIEKQALLAIHSRMGEEDLTSADKDKISIALDSIDMAEKELKDLKKLFGEK